MTTDNPGWPSVDLDPVRRLRVLAAALPGAVVVDRFLPIPIEPVWRVAADLEHQLPKYQPHVTQLAITAADGERMECLVRGHAGLRARFQLVLRPGWCWMQSRYLYFGLAATPVDGGTLLARAGGTRLPGSTLLTQVRRRGLHQELDRLVQLVVAQDR